MSRATRLSTPVGLLTILLLAGCGGGADQGDSRDEAEAGAPAPAAEPATDPATSATAPLGVEDIERWEKGMAAELAAVQEAGQKLATARTGEDTLAAVMGVQEMTTAAIGAKAAGVDLERYNALRSELSAAVAYLTPHLGGIDTTMLSPAQRDEMRQMNAARLQEMEARVPPSVVDALRPKAEALRKKDLELVGARLKSAGM
ncbi:MAG: hypothetical protein ACREM9_00340 [Gemmatimonadales bacterium]